MKRLVAFVAVVIAGIVALALLRGPEDDPRRAIRKVIDDGAAALERLDVAGAAALLHESYKDERGLRKKDLQGLAFVALRRGPILIAFTKVDIALAHEKATTAEAHVEGLVLQGSTELKTARDLLPKDGRAFAVDLAFVRDDDDWRVTAIDGISAGLFE